MESQRNSPRGLRRLSRYKSALLSSDLCLSSSAIAPTERELPPSGAPCSCSGAIYPSLLWGSLLSLYSCAICKQLQPKMLSVTSLVIPKLICTLESSGKLAEPSDNHDLGPWAVGLPPLVLRKHRARGKEVKVWLPGRRSDFCLVFV